MAQGANPALEEKALPFQKQKKKKNSQKRAFPEISRNEAAHPTSFQMKAFNIKMLHQMERPQSVLPALYGARVTWTTSLLQL